MTITGVYLARVCSPPSQCVGDSTAAPGGGGGGGGEQDRVYMTRPVPVASGMMQESIPSLPQSSD